MIIGQRLKKLLPLLLIFSACFLFEGEKEDEQNTNLTLSLHSAGVTSVNLNVEPEDSLSSFTFELVRDDSTVQTLSLQSDTIIKDNGLNPNTNYTYTGYWMDGAERIGESNTLSVNTMDTTSHDFTWEIDTLGAYGSELNDVWIVNENDIWVVGALSIDDSSLNYEGHINYNAAHWNGGDWDYLKIGDTMPQGHFAMTTLYGIHYFNENDIWVISGVPLHWNGEEWEHYLLHYMDVLPNSSLSNGALWGTSSNNMYFVGLNGSIVHYNGNEFVKMESGTDVDLRDISGNEDGSRIFATGYLNTDGRYESVTVYYMQGEWSVLFSGSSYFGDIEQEDFGWMTTVDVFSDTCYIVSREGLIKYDFINESYSVVEPWQTRMNGEDFYGLTVQNTNDIMSFGRNGFTSHFNGKSWHRSKQIDLHQKPAWIKKGQLKNNIAIRVGELRNYNNLEKSGAIVCIGTRNN